MSICSGRSGGAMPAGLLPRLWRLVTRSTVVWRTSFVSLLGATHTYADELRHSPLSYALCTGLVLPLISSHCEAAVASCAQMKGWGVIDSQSHTCWPAMVRHALLYQTSALVPLDPHGQPAGCFQRGPPRQTLYPFSGITLLALGSRELPSACSRTAPALLIAERSQTSTRNQHSSPSARRAAQAPSRHGTRSRYCSDPPPHCFLLVYGSLRLTAISITCSTLTHSRDAFRTYCKSGSVLLIPSTPVLTYQPPRRDVG